MLLRTLRSALRSTLQRVRCCVLHIRTLSVAQHDTDVLLLHSAMQLLVDYVEIDLALLQLYTARNAAVQFRHKVVQRVPGAWRCRALVRSRDLGLARLAWEKQLHLRGAQPNSACSAAATVERLYVWWCDERPQRVEPEVASGLTAFLAQLRADNLPVKFGCLDDDACAATVPDAVRERIRAQITALLAQSDAIARAHFDEDTANLKALIEIRSYLWR